MSKPGTFTFDAAIRVGDMLSSFVLDDTERSLCFAVQRPSLLHFQATVRVEPSEIHLLGDLNDV